MVKVPIPCHGCKEPAHIIDGVHETHIIERYYDGYMISNLDLLKQAVEKKWDGVLLYGGYEGDGKSTLCSQHMAYLDPTFDLSRVVFSVDALGKLMDSLPPGSAVQYDESWKDTSGGARYSENQRKLIKLLTEKRKRRLYIGIVTATPFDCVKYFFIHRTRAYIHIYADGLQRGYFSFYNRQQKQDLYIKGHRDWDMRVVDPAFRGRFTDWLPYDSEEYEHKKDESTKSEEEEQKPRIVDPQKLYLDGNLEALSFLNDRGWLRHGAMSAWAEYKGILPTSLSHQLKQFSLRKQQDSQSTAVLASLLPTNVQLTNNNELADFLAERRGDEP